MVFVRFDAQVVALTGREGAVAHADHGHGVPFQAFRLVHGHEHHIDGGIWCGGVVIGRVTQRIHPRDERAQAWRALRGDFLQVGVHQRQHRVE